jgi:hypothetical protein
MIVTIPGWPGTFDIDYDYDPGSPDGWMEPGDPPSVSIEFATWEFDGRNCITVAPPHMDDELYRLLEEAFWVEHNKDPLAFYPSYDDYL